MPKILTEWELWACANECVRQHGSEASSKAIERATELLDADDIDGSLNWELIASRVVQLLDGPAGRAN